MKKYLLVFTTTFLIMAFYQASPVKNKIHIANGYFYTNIINGINTACPIAFSIDKKTIGIIRGSDDYLATKKDSIFLKNNIKISHDTICLFLMSQVESAAISTKMQLKNITSFTIPFGATGEIYIGEEGLTISFPFQSQNGYGNMVFATSITNMSGTHF